MLYLIFMAGAVMQEAHAQPVWPEFFTPSGGSSGGGPLRMATPDKIQTIYSPGHFNAASTTIQLRPGYINSLYIQCFFYSDTTAYHNFTIRLGYTDRNLMSSGPYLEGLTTVLQQTTYTLNKTGYQEWLEIPLQTPFFYDGVRNLVLEVSHNGMVVTRQGFEWLLENRGRNMTLGGNPALPNGAEQSAQYSIGFDLDSRNNNAGILGLANNGFCSGNQDVQVQLVNNGMNRLDSVQINWSVDGQMMTPVKWMTPLDTLGSAAGNIATVTLGSVNVGTAPRNIKVWTSQPNGQADPVSADDTATALIRSALSGVYTVGGSSPDYATLTAAVQHLNEAGVCGPVRFNLRNGTYDGRVDLIRVKGTSAFNRITFTSESGNTADVRILDTAITSSDKNYVFRLTETSFVTLKNLTLEDTGRLAYGRVVVLQGQTSSDSIVNCVIRAQPHLLTGGTAGSSGHNKSPVHANGVMGSDYVVTDNRIINGAIGMSLSGGAAPYERIERVVVSGNTFENNYGVGVEVFRASDVTITGNEVAAAPVTGVNNTITGIYTATINGWLDISGNTVQLNGHYNATGIQISTYNGLTLGGRFRNNKVTLHDGTRTQSGISFSSVNSAQNNERFVVSNNVVHVKGAYGTPATNVTERGMFVSTAGNTDFLNNTVYVDNSNAAWKIAHAFYLTNSASTINLRLRNNIIANAGPAGYAMHVNVPIHYDGDYNNIFSGGGYITVGSTTSNRDTFHTLTEWRDTVKQERNSLSYRPGLNTADLTPNPADSAAWSINGRGVHIAGNDRDINGSPRSVTPATGVPDLGAYEFVPTSVPPLAHAAPAVPAAGTSQVFTFGEDTVAVVNWAAGSSVPASLPVRQYSGKVAPALPYDSMYFYTDLTLAGNYQFEVRIYYKDPWIGTMPSEDMITLAQGNGVAPWQDYSFSGTTDTVRNILSAPNLTTFNLFTGSNAQCIGQPGKPALLASIFRNAVCSGSEIDLSAEGDRSAGITWQWLRSENPNGPWAPVSGGTGANTSRYKTYPLTDTVLFRVAITCANSGLSDTSEYHEIPVLTPGLPEAAPGVVCGSGTAELSASTTPGLYLGWYDAATGGRLMDTGRTFTTPQISAATSFWVSSSTGAALYAGKKTPNNASPGNNQLQAGFVFTVTEPFDLEAVHVYPTQTGQGSLIVTLTDSTGNVLRTVGPVTLPAGTGTSVLTGATPFRVPLNLTQIEPGTYRLLVANLTGSLILDGTGTANYPYALGNVGEIRHATDAAGNTLLSAYNYFYDWQISTGCQGPRKEVVVTISDVPQPVIAPAGAQITTGSFETYQWQINGTDIPGADQQSYTPTQNGNYAVKVTNRDGCIGISQPYAFALSVTEMPAAGGVRIYPNPARDMVYFDAAEPLHVTVTDPQGRTVYSGKHIQSVSLAGLADGIYLVYVRNDAGILLKAERITKTGK